VSDSVLSNSFHCVLRVLCLVGSGTAARDHIISLRISIEIKSARVAYDVVDIC
jgi:hypothetical protein